MRDIGDKKIGIRIIALAILIILSVALLYTVYADYQLPTDVERDVSRCDYEHDGDFHYIAHIKPTSIYDNKSTIGPNEVCFSKITNHLDMFFYYTFRSTKPAEVNGNYEIIALVESPNQWERRFIIVPKTAFNSSERVRSAEFTSSFPLNITHYNNIVNEVGDEIGMRPANPKLTILTNIHTIAKTNAGNIDETFSPAIEIPLNKDIIEINGDLHQHTTGSIGKTERFYQQWVVYKRYYSLAALVLCLIILIVFSYTILATKQEGKGREADKVKKKYDDWIVDTDILNLPSHAGDRVIPLNSLEDLIKVAEELGKPVIHKMSTPKGKHTYHVFDGATRYDYTLM